MSNTNEGWIKLHRKIRENPLWQENRSFSKAEAWIDILMEARHSDEPAKVLIGSHIIECGRGQIIKSLDTLASRWGWNKSKVRRFLDLLNRLEQIRHENVTKTTRITICNYDTYNSPRNADETQMKRERHADETQATPNKNVKNEKKAKKKTVTPKEPKKPYGEFDTVMLTDTEYKALQSRLSSKRLSFGIEYLDGYKKSKGKKYDSDYAVFKKGGWLMKVINEECPRSFASV